MGLIQAGFNEYLAFQFELLFAQKGFKLKGTTSGVYVSAYTTLNYLEIPLLFRASYPLGPVSIYSILGPYVGFGLKASVGSSVGKIGSYSFKDLGLHPVDFGLCFGGGAGFHIGRSELFLDLRYDLGLVDCNNIDDSDKPSGYKANCNRNFAISIGYLMPLGK